MTDLSEFSALVRLLDDESPEVRVPVARRLLEYEEGLVDWLDQLNPPLAAGGLRLLDRILREAKCETLGDHWDQCLTEPDAIARLEIGLGLLADYLDGERFRSVRTKQALDDLAEECLRAADGAILDGQQLIRFLFHSGRLSGNRDDYYSPDNSNLLTVLEQGRGNPISLVCILMLIGRRLKISVGGCNYPGHFLGLLHQEDGPQIVDCFNGGQIVPIKDLLQPDPEAFPELRAALERGAPVEVILLRVLRNLQRAFQYEKRTEEQRLMEHLIERMLVSGVV